MHPRSSGPGTDLTPYRNKLMWSLRLETEHEHAYWAEHGDRKHLRSDLVYGCVMVLLHVTLLLRPIHTIFFATRVCRLAAFAFHLSAQVGAMLLA